ncbi:hypothetical protein A3F00_04655 [Candidatus Daviesbacteria bacterium RIFCSPHIGHO2_12_FULL_37_11]|uniref:Uncharacterized protein n=1 Tax=Candidatus Daviesbacteria bacterium RIFCSPHIGHO2_12_FULL_37_11 TaxID=1797777 RepID=A0A1F5KEF9_9BACT|nr:MAG: hypothetical protein A2111_03100 [Candidatus Daviesbacteria bacterium GWA1_38_6]OGE16508.1 MAG: hypothetical protein A2769_02430 [Candidatus Daviesbacteria bacterium RIFCSPHIGHO2_01_FULL_37_27]OGE39165.1 MAG: hypothetical protein A3F00_04655 [Candidatus Daviesbacteria bacterium RIFCSPHIGHO2_12_FULL_37_11]OGE45595.1 MAG: hypothetical protein A3B39_02220 [Candidatus Daviesbacteria bacterium RIFCSPLOWO2_01_FULL_37_10]
MLKRFIKNHPFGVSIGANLSIIGLVVGTFAYHSTEDGVKYLNDTKEISDGVYSTMVRFGRTFPVNQVGIPLIVKTDTGIPIYGELKSSIFEAEFLSNTIGIYARNKEELRNAHEYIVELCGLPKSTAELGVAKISERSSETLFYEGSTSSCLERR